MRPMQLNLRSEEPLLKSLLLPVAVVVMLACLCLAAYTINLYVLHQREIGVYEQKISSARNRSTDRPLQEKAGVMDAARKEGIGHDLQFLKGLLAKKMIPVSEILDVIEIRRPDKVVIDKVEFSRDFRQIIVMGKSALPEAVSTFLLALDDTAGFTVGINRGELDEMKNFIFEITINR